ncbi:MAG: glycosyltransferase family 2 protein [Chloroflexota bacterium]
MASISVIIRTYTEARWDSLLAAVSSARQQTRPPEEIVLVVDHNQKLYERLRTAVPMAVVVENRGAAGSSGAWNAGIQAATGEIIAFIDDDAVAAPDWLAELERGYRQPETIGVGGAILPMWLDGRPRWFPDEFAWVVGCTYRGLPEDETSVRNLIGCNMSFRREAFDLAGGFLGAEQGIGHMGASPIGGDETEFCIRL